MTVTCAQRVAPMRRGFCSVVTQADANVQMALTRHQSTGFVVLQTQTKASPVLQKKKKNTPQQPKNKPLAAAAESRPHDDIQDLFKLWMLDKRLESSQRLKATGVNSDLPKGIVGRLAPVSNQVETLGGCVR